MKLFQYTNTFNLESGETLDGFTLAYHTWGDFSKGKKVLWVCHALTGNANVFDWWEDLFGADKLFDPNEYFIVCSNIIGSCYGSTGPITADASGNKPYLDFPLVSTRDAVNAQIELADYLNLRKIDLLIGGSIGGQQALEWSILKPEFIEKQVLIATNARHSSFGIAFNESQRMALSADSSFYDKSDNAGSKGLKCARSIALLSYRSYEGYVMRQVDDDEAIDNFKAASYQQYQGEKLAERFNAHAYYYLTKMMDSHNVGRGRNGITDALKIIIAKTLVIGISSDSLFPVQEQTYLAEHINEANYVEVNSPFGHDGFLIETKQLENILKKFITDLEIKNYNRLEKLEQG